MWLGRVATSRFRRGSSVTLMLLLLFRLLSGTSPISWPVQSRLLCGPSWPPPPPPPPAALPPLNDAMIITPAGGDKTVEGTP
uniref:Putative secreted protein n=1 Tax=Anopheles marajoara TaxID=58244 RepID=A0A2M4CBE0_9DIPT